MKKSDNPLLIPFGKAVRVGAFKLWRSTYMLKSGKEGSRIECLNVSTPDGAWMVRIPATSMMYSTLVSGYATVDEELRDNFIGMIVTNIFNLSTVPSIALHDMFSFLMEMMSYPYLFLPEKEMEKRMKAQLREAGMEKGKAKEHIAQMMEYRHRLYELLERKKDSFIEDYERQMVERMSGEEEAMKHLEQDAVAEQASEIAVSE